MAPAFQTPIPDLREYDVVLPGYPVWAQDMPRFVADFISQCDLADKTVIPFATYGMTGIGWTMKHLKQLCADAQVKFPFDSGVLKKGNYTEWIEKIKSLKNAAG